MLLRRAFTALVCSGLVLVAMVVVDLHGQASAEEAGTTEPAVGEPVAVPAPPDEEPVEPELPEDPSAATDGADATESPEATGDGAGTAGPLPTTEGRDAAEAPDAVRGVVQVLVMGERQETRRIGSGFVVQPNHVVTAAHLVEDEGNISVVVPSESAGRSEFVARVRHVARHADLALLVVNGLDLEPLVLAKDGFDIGRSVVSTGFWDVAASGPTSGSSAPSAAESRGAVGEHRLLPATRDDAAVELLRHNAMIPAAGYGSPLLNDCGQVVGVNRGSPEVSRRALRRGEPPQNVVYAAGVTAIFGLLQPTGVTLARTESSCLDPVAVAQADADEARRAEEEARRAGDDAARRAAEREAEAAAKQAELDQAREELDAVDAHVEDLERRLAEAEGAGAEDAESLQAELEEARGNQNAAQQRVNGLEEEAEALNRVIEGLRRELEREAEKGRQNLVITIVVAVAAVLLLAIVAGVLYRRRSLELAQVRQRAAAGQPQGAYGRPLPNDASAEHGPDYLLTGTTGDGQTISLKIPGSMLSGGVVIGRSPRNANFLIDDKTLSREHARLSMLRDGELCIEDLGATNGTRVNGRELQPRVPATIRDGDTLDLGAVKLRVMRQR